MKKQRRLFCEIHPLFYAISTQKSIAIRHVKNILSKEKIAKEKRALLPHVVFSKTDYLIKKGKDIDPKLQENKVVNIKLASDKISKIVIQPGEVFSFWKCVGTITRRKGYKDGRVIMNNKLVSGIGGGICNLANTIHVLILHSPLDVVEFHMHSDALAPDPDGKRVPFSAGTSVWYNYGDYTFKNNTDQCFQLVLSVDGENSYAELRSEKEMEFSYKLLEENHHFTKENEKYYRVSQIYKLTTTKNTNEIIKKELVLDNHSKVMFDYDLIPKELIR